MSTFPAEIIEKFVFHINEDTERINTLRSCILVSQTWYQIAQPFVYRRMSLEVDDEDEVKSVVDLLSNHPHIRTYIHHLVIVGLLDFAATAFNLGSLPSLRSLHIQSRSGPRGEKYSMTEDPDLAKSIYPIMGSQFLTSLQMSHVHDVPAQLLRQCVALQALAIRHTTFSRNSETNVEQQIALKRLVISNTRHISVEDVNDTVTWLLSPRSPFVFSQLETYMGLHDNEDPQVSYEAQCKFISHVSPSLKTILIIPPPSSTYRSYRLRDLQNSLDSLEPQKLQNVTSITTVARQNPRNPSDLPWLITLLSLLPRPEILHDLTILCWLHLSDLKEVDLDRHSEKWSGLDALLTHFHHLRRVHLECYTGRNDTITRDRVPWLLSALPRLNERGILSITDDFSMSTDEVIEELEQRFMHQ
ncbi:hypothetical protein BDN72DRAFT_838625 [Pluteus cervinus]|uniref:Uncharacterized protein n=1 Tax=Pluteus cervinus TaxID=181527 RepID=A0ACD3AYB1_9AGAR|nr:hypothetical protein BDN72DRAFT_838625 [Pluteus cervinus]